MRKKRLFYLPLLLTVLLLAGCDGPKPSTSTTTSVSSLEQPEQEVDIFSSDLPPLSDFEEWSLPLSVNYVAEQLYYHGDDTENSVIAFTQRTDAELNNFNNGFKVDASITIDEQKMEGKRYVYHVDGTTYDYMYAPDYNEENSYEMINVEKWEAFEDRDFAHYDEMFATVVLDMLDEWYWMFAEVYELFSEIHNQALLDEFVEVAIEDYGEDAVITVRFYRQGNRHTLKVIYEYTEYEEVIIGEEFFALEIINGLPARLIYGVNETRDELPRDNHLDVIFAYTDELPAYDGPFMPAI